MRALPLFVILLFLSCGDTPNSDGERSAPEAGDTLPRFSQQPQSGNSYSMEPYVNKNYNFETKWLSEWRITETPPRQSLKAVNLYSPALESELELPLTVHARASVTHLSAYPEGWGTGLPAGGRLKAREYQGNLPVAFTYDPESSYIFLLDTGEPWAYLIRPAQPPQSWGDNGYLFAQIGLEDYASQCFDGDTGEPKPDADCDPMAGDRVVRSGQLKEPDRTVIRQALQEWAFFEEAEERRPLSDLIKVNQPLPNDDIDSPVKIEGKARGQWYFEGDFPVELQDKDYNTIATGIAQAQGQWMTTNFVPFQLTLEYEDAPDDERGYLVFQRSNASGRAAQDRAYRLPVLFPPE